MEERRQVSRARHPLHGWSSYNGKTSTRLNNGGTPRPEKTHSSSARNTRHSVISWWKAYPPHSPEVSMPKYLVEARYTVEGTKGLVREGGSGRRAAVAKTIESVGGKVEALYFAFGDVDVYVIVDVPDNVSAAAVSLAANQSGAIVNKTIVLLTPEEMDKSVQKAVSFRPPG